MPQHNRDEWTSAWSERYESGEPAAEGGTRRRFRMPLRGRTNGAHVILATVLASTVIAPFAVAQSGGNGSRIESNDDRYAFLARNTRDGDGGAGALACNSDANGAGETNREPCLNMVNSGTGYAAAFRTRGLTGFRLQTSGSGTATPFLLDQNATGKVTYLNADQLDGLSAEQVGREKFARVNFTAPNDVALATGANGVTAVSRTGVGRYQVTFDGSVANCAFQTTSGAVGQARVMAAEPLATDPTKADVSLRRVSGADEGEPVDGRFSIAANC